MKPQFNLIEQQWIILRDGILPPGTAPVQVETARRLFYAGAIAVFRAQATMPPELALETVAAIHAELKAFKEAQRELDDPYVKTPQ